MRPQEARRAYKWQSPARYRIWLYGNSMCAHAILRRRIVSSTCRVRARVVPARNARVWRGHRVLARWSLNATQEDPHGKPELRVLPGSLQ